MAKKRDPLEAPLTTLRHLSAALPGAEEYVMVHHPAFRVGKKPFAIVGMDQSTTLSINLGPEAQLDLLSDARFTRTHYIGQHGWVTVDYDALDAGEVASLVEGSWQRIAGKKHLAAHAGSKLSGGGAAPRRTETKASAAGKARAPQQPAGAAKKSSSKLAATRGSVAKRPSKKAAAAPANRSSKKAPAKRTTLAKKRAKTSA